MMMELEELPQGWARSWRVVAQVAGIDVEWLSTMLSHPSSSLFLHNGKRMDCAFILYLAILSFY